MILVFFGLMVIERCADVCLPATRGENNRGDFAVFIQK